MSSYHFTLNGSPVDEESSDAIGTSDSEQETGVVVIRAYPRARGGKGGELGVWEKFPGSKIRAVICCMFYRLWCTHSCNGDAN